MRLKPSVLLLALAGLVPAATAHAASPAPTAHAAPLAGVKVGNCQGGDQSSDRKATFVGRMRSVPGSSQLAMRFQLEERYGGRKFTRVSAPELRGPRKSRAGVQSYTYSQSVTSLVAGEEYRVQVQFRWLDSNGKTVLQLKRYSGTCDEPGQLPNLEVLNATARPGVVPGTEAYTVNVLNAGLGPASDVHLQLVVDGASPDTATLDSLAPGEVHAIHFTGPACKHRMRSTVDPSDTIHESVESDNSLAGGCPPQG